MIKLNSKISAAGFDAIREEFTPFDLPETIGKKIRPLFDPMLDKLEADPGPVARPIQWTSVKQRKAYFATNGFGRGIPTKRTNRARRSWKVRDAIKQGRYQIIIENTVPYAQFLYGSLNMRSLNEAMKPQQRFHRNTGYPLAQPIVKQATEQARAEVKRLVSEETKVIEARIRRRSRRS